MYRYAQSLAVGTTQQANFSLLDPAQWSTTAEVAGRIEDEADRYTIVRIIGQFGMATAELTDATVIRVWPGLEDASGVVEANVPGSILSSPTAANERFWWERRISNNAIPSSIADCWDPVFDPWWFMLDCKPGQMMEEGLTPVLSIYNSSATETLLSQFYLRMLIWVPN